MFDLRFTIGLTDLIGSDPKDLIRKSNPMTWGPWWGFFSNTSILRDIGKGSAEKNCNFQTSQELQRSFCLKKICVQVIFLLSKNFRNTFCKGELVHIYIYICTSYIYIYIVRLNQTSWTRFTFCLCKYVQPSWSHDNLGPAYCLCWVLKQSWRPGPRPALLSRWFSISPRWRYILNLLDVTCRIIPV